MGVYTPGPAYQDIYYQKESQVGMQGPLKGIGLYPEIERKCFFPVYRGLYFPVYRMRGVAVKIISELHPKKASSFPLANIE